MKTGKFIVKPININDVMKKSRFEISAMITGIKIFKIRLWLGILFIKIAIFVIGGHPNITIEKEI